jgi:hypothetical protein
VAGKQALLFLEEKEAKRLFRIWAMSVGIFDSHGPESKKFLRRGRPAAFFQTAAFFTGADQ